MIPYFHHHLNYPEPLLVTSPMGDPAVEWLDRPDSVCSIWPCQPSTAFCGLSGNVVQYVDHKHFMSKKTGRNFPLSTRSQTCSLPLLLSLLGNGRAKAKGTIWAEPQPAAAFPGFPVLYLKQLFLSTSCCREGWADFQSRRHECADLGAQTFEADTNFKVTSSKSPKTFYPNTK